MKRRKFIQSAVAVSAAGAIFNQKGEALNSSKDLPHGIDWQKAPCRFCGTGCGVLVGVKDNKIVAVQGDLENPVNKGLLCVKGYNAGNALYGEDRLRFPQMRKNGQLVQVSWDEALDKIADQIMKDPSKFALYGSGQWTIPEGFTAMKFMKGGLSSNQIEPNARLCMASAVTGFLSTFGVDEPAGCYDDFEECNTVLFWGCNPAEMHPILFSRLVDRRSNKDPIQLYDLCTRRTRTSDFSDRVILFKPNSDLAIANGISHLLVKEGKYDKEFVKKHLTFKKGDDLAGKPSNWDEFVKFLEDYTPEKVEKMSGVDSGTIRHLADLFADSSKKIMSLWCMGVNQHFRGTAMNNLIYNAHLLSGKIGSPGNSPFSLTGQPSACGTCREVGTLAHALPGGRLVANGEHRKECEEMWNLPEGRLNPKPGFHTVRMFEALSSGELTSVWIQVTNPAQSLPNLGKLFKNLKDRFVVVSDIYPTETIKHATIVLPSAGWVEKNGIFGNTERRTQQWFKMITPPGEARDDVWQMIAVARKLFEKGHPGMKDKNGNFLFDMFDGSGKKINSWEWRDFNRVNVDKILYEQYRPFTVKKHKNVAPYDELVKTRGLRWPVVQTASGIWQETRYRFVEGEDPFVEKDKGIDFYHGPGKRAVLWQRPFEEAAESPDAQYPFWLCTGRVMEHWHTGTMTRRVPILHKAMPSAYVEFHPQDAKENRIKNGDLVKLTSRRGSLTLEAKVLGRGTPQKGMVFVPFFDEDKLINRLTLDAHCPISKEPDYKKCAVKIEKVSL